MSSSLLQEDDTQSNISEKNSLTSLDETSSDKSNERQENATKASSNKSLILMEVVKAMDLKSRLSKSAEGSFQS